MAEWLFKKFIIILSVLLLKAPIFAIDINQYNDFSSRSIIMQQMAPKSQVNQELKDLMQNKKLNPTAQCLIEQIKKNNIENVEILLRAKIGPNISYMTDYPIYIASKYNRVEIAKLLIEYGAKLDLGFYSELYEAVKHKNTYLAQIYINMNAKVNYTDSISNKTILYWAIKNKMIDIAQELINRGAKPDLKTYKLLKKKKLLHLINSKN